jgi:hypothetical protein
LTIAQELEGHRAVALDMTLQATRRGIIAARLHRSAASRFLWQAKGLASLFDYLQSRGKRAL